MNLQKLSALCHPGLIDGMSEKRLLADLSAKSIEEMVDEGLLAKNYDEGIEFQITPKGVTGLYLSLISFDFIDDDSRINAVNIVVNEDSIDYQQEPSPYELSVVSEDMMKVIADIGPFEQDAIEEYLESLGKGVYAYNFCSESGMPIEEDDDVDYIEVILLK